LLSKSAYLPEIGESALTADYVIPWLMTVLPALINIKWVVSGFAGACLTLVLVTAWAYMTGKNR
jgi:hypothetical protein